LVGRRAAVWELAALRCVFRGKKTRSRVVDDISKRREFLLSKRRSFEPKAQVSDVDIEMNGHGCCCVVSFLGDVTDEYSIVVEQVEARWL
jgi:hypothetical protein